MKATLYLLTFFSVCVGFSLACSCLPRTFPEHYCSADAVLECQFTSRRESRGKIIYNCRIERVHKGNITTRTIQVVTPKSPAACGVTFLTGCNAPTYLITTRMEVISATRNQKVLHINLCDYYDPDPEKPVLEFLRNPSCPCARLQCRPWQKCKVYVRPNCNITSVNTGKVSAVKEGVVSADGDASIDDMYAEREQITGDLTIRPPTEKTCRVSYCADTCNGFPCPNGTRCRLVDVNCVTEPCPPIARCFKFNPCDTVLCAPNHVCKVDENGQPYCEPQCPVCPPGYHCEKIPVICVRAPCPPQRKCVPDNPIDPCRLQIDVGTYIDNVVSVDDEQERFAFDITKRACVPFMYRGDGGNDNNFLTLEECERICPNIPPCKQALVVGPCRAAIPRWFHNVTSGKCEKFTYGGCGGNDNNFPSEERCQATCPPPSPCKLKVDTGSNCIGTPKLRWYHDVDTRTCKQFNFTGCGGNRNNFGSRTDCEKICPPPNPCVQPRLHGVGDHQSVVVRWWHNPRTLQCEQFKYLGTGGNNNNFLTKAECERRCPPPNPCKLKADPGPCRGAFRRWYYNYQSGRCERFVYGGCGGNANNFQSLRDCHAKCRPIRVCKLPKVVGPCLARIPRWWHNPLTRRCERFWYGGCNGNKNNFVSKYHCERRCRPRCKIPDPCDRIRCRKHQVCKIYKPTGQPYCADTCNNFTCPSGYKCELRKVYCIRAPCPPVAKCVKIPPADPCELPVVKGPCKAYIPRFFFNKATGKCQRFIYGGCGGNSNNFRSLRDCRRRCAPPGVCRLPLDIGPCDGTNPRWGFNVKSGKCEQFNWGGCQGNRNRFVSEAACKAQCPTLPKCKQPKFSCKTGTNCVCTAQVRYFFNQKSGACEQYPADECPLNDNTFNSRTECETTCPVQRCKLHPDVGPCDCHTVRWYFDHQLGYCRRFKYGGCKGNSNNFLTYDSCKTACHPDPCALPLIRGRGAERHVRFYHNPKTRICESFEYSGQDANENNFHTLEDCENRCPPPRNCSGCTGPLSLTKTDVTRDVLEENVQNGWCCATHSTAARLCCCPATSDRASSCQNGGVWVATRPKAEEPDEVDLVEEDLEVPEFADPLDEETGTLLED